LRQTRQQNGNLWANGRHLRKMRGLQHRTILALVPCAKARTMYKAAFFRDDV